jgi:hypothetical protein
VTIDDLATISLMATYCEAEQHISHQLIDEQQARSLTRTVLTRAGVPATDADKVAATNLGLPGLRAAVVMNEEMVS